MEVCMKSTVNRHGQYVALYADGYVAKWYTVTVDGDVKVTTKDLAYAERKYELWRS